LAETPEKLQIIGLVFVSVDYITDTKVKIKTYGCANNDFYPEISTA